MLAEPLCISLTQCPVIIKHDEAEELEEELFDLADVEEDA